MRSNSPINLVLIQQTHRPDDIEKKFNLQDYRLKPIIREVIYSQFKIMQILSTLQNAAILTEGCARDVTAADLKKQFSKIFRAIFPTHDDLLSLDFNRLTENQLRVLWQSFATQIMFNLGLVPAVYQTLSTSTEEKVTLEIIDNFSSSFNEILLKYPNLSKNMKNEYLSNYQMPSEKKEYSDFYAEVSKKNPDLFYHREKEALDFALLAAKKSGKKLVVLIFGKDHLYGISNLINTEYKDRIILKEVIDSTKGFWCAESEAYLKKLEQEGMSAYKKGEYASAAEHYQDLVTFWRATPKSTPKKQSSLYTAEFNLGSSLLKLSEAKGVDCENALLHLEQADILTKDNPEKNKKYHERYLGTAKRHQLLSFFSDESWKTPAQIIIDYASENYSP